MQLYIYRFRLENEFRFFSVDSNSNFDTTRQIIGNYFSRVVRFLFDFLYQLTSKFSTDVMNVVMKGAENKLSCFFFNRMFNRDRYLVLRSREYSFQQN